MILEEEEDDEKKKSNIQKILRLSKSGIGQVSSDNETVDKSGFEKSQTI